MKKYWIFITFLWMTQLCGAQVRNIHVLYLMDNNNYRLKNAIQSMNEGIELEILKMKTALQANVQKYYATGAKYNSNFFFQTVENMNIQAMKDIVILAILGHGSNEGTNPYPTLRFGDTDKRNFSEIADLILVKRPAYLVSVVNTCNGFETPQILSLSQEFLAKPLVIGAFKAENYQKLFEKRDYPVAVTYLSAQAGGVTSVGADAGTPFLALLEALQYWTAENAGREPSWEKILLTAQTISVQRTQKESFLECPYMEISQIRIENGQIQQKGYALKLCK